MREYKNTQIADNQYTYNFPLFPQIPPDSLVCSTCKTGRHTVTCFAYGACGPFFISLTRKRSLRSLGGPPGTALTLRVRPNTLTPALFPLHLFGTKTVLDSSYIIYFVQYLIRFLCQPNYIIGQLAQITDVLAN